MEQYVKFLKNTETGAVTDAMNVVGVKGWMYGLHPENPKVKFSGRAFTVRLTKLREAGQKFWNMFELYDQIQPGDVLCVTSDTPDSTVGENMMHALLMKGGAGMVLDGSIRDAGVIADAALPICSRGPSICVSTEYKITAFQEPIVCGGALVEPGDYIVGDVDGVIAIPQARIADVVYQAEQVVRVESEMEQAIKNNCTMQQLMQISSQKRVPRAK